MPFSSAEGKGFFEDWLFHMMVPGHITTIFDVGAGCGSYYELAKNCANAAEQYRPNIKKDMVINGSEIHAPYISHFKLEEKYNSIMNTDIREVAQDLDPHDLFIFGDVLEHLTKDEAIDVLSKIKKKSRFIWLSIPTKACRPWSNEYNQHEDEWTKSGNPNEQHLHMWDIEELGFCFGPFTGLCVFPVVTVAMIEGDIK